MTELTQKADVTADQPSPGLGHNQPPELTPFEESQQEIGDLYLEANHWLDGEPVTTQAHADGVAKLMSLLRQAVKTADERRKAEVKPFDDGKKKVQDRYNALIGDTKSVKGKAVLALDVCKQALAPFLAKQEAEKRAAAAAAQKEALDKERAARRAVRESAGDIAKRAEAEALVQEAKQAERDAKSAHQDRAKARGGVGRAAALRTTYQPVLIDNVAALHHYWPTHGNRLAEMLVTFAQEDVRAGFRSIPGFEIKEIKSVV